MELNEAIETLFQFVPIENIEEATICVHAIEREFKKVKEDRAREREKTQGWQRASQEWQWKADRQSEILRILKERARYVDVYGGVHNEPIPDCDVTIVIYDEDESIEKIKQWLEEKQ